MSASVAKPKSKPDAPCVWLRIDKAHIARVIKARRALCVGEGVQIATQGIQ